MIVSSCSTKIQNITQDNAVQLTNTQIKQGQTKFESISSSLKKIVTTAEISCNAIDPKTIYKRFPEIITAEVTDISYAINFNEKICVCYALLTYKIKGG